MKKPRQMMVQRFVAACAAAFLASAAPGGEDSPPLRRGADGFGDVRSAAFFARDGKMDKAKLGEFLKLATASAGHDGESPADGLDWRMIFAIKGCRSDRATFRMMAAFRDEDDPPLGTAQVPLNAYGQPLASVDALVKTSSAGRDDTPEDHARVSDATPYDPKRPGLFATRSETSPSVVVELAGDVSVAGVTVVGDARGLTAWVSQDGKDWQEVASDGGSEAGWRIDLGGKSPTAKFVKVGRVGGEKKSLSLAKVLVYGKRLF